MSRMRSSPSFPVKSIGKPSKTCTSVTLVLLDNGRLDGFDGSAGRHCPRERAHRRYLSWSSALSVTSTSPAFSSASGCSAVGSSSGSEAAGSDKGVCSPTPFQTRRALQRRLWPHEILKSRSPVPLGRIVGAVGHVLLLLDQLGAVGARESAWA